MRRSITIWPLGGASVFDDPTYTTENDCDLTGDTALLSVELVGEKTGTLDDISLSGDDFSKLTKKLLLERLSKRGWFSSSGEVFLYDSVLRVV